MKVINNNSKIETQINIEKFHFYGVTSISSWAERLAQLQPLIDEAAGNGTVNPKSAQGAKTAIEEVIKITKTNEPTTKKITKYLSDAKDWVSGAGNLALALDKAIEAFGKLGS